MEEQNKSAFYGLVEDDPNEAVGCFLDLTSKYGLLGQAEIARCVNELLGASLTLGQTLPAHTFIVSRMDTNRN